MNIGPQRYILPFLVTFLLACIHVGDACPQDESVSDAGAANQANRDRVLVRLVPSKVRKTQFEVKFMLYRIQLGPDPGDIEYFEAGDTSASGRQRIEEVLKNPVGIVFEEIHLRDVLDFITKTYEINIIVDNRVVGPPGPKGPNKKPANDNSDYVTDGIIQYVNLKNVRLDEALKAILRPLGLDYSVQSGFIWVSTPENLASESFGLLYRPSSRFTFRQNGAYTFFDRETIVLGRPELTWSGKLQQRRHREISLLWGRVIHMMLQEGREAEIRVDDSTPIQYLEPQTDSDSTTFVLRTLDEPAGLRAAFTVTSRSIPEEVDVAVSLSANIVGERAPVEGVFLNVGKPQLTRTEHSGTHRVALGGWASLLGSADRGSALLLLFKVSSLDKLLSAAREDPPPVDYVMEARILRYDGRLEKEFAKAHPSNATQKAVRLYDAVLPLRRERVDLNARDLWDTLEKFRGLELLSAPRMTLQQSDVMRKQQLKTIVVLRQNRDTTQSNEGLLEALSRLAPDGHVLPISESDWIGKGIIADVKSQFIPYEKTTTVNGLPVGTTDFKEVQTGVLLMVGVDATENRGYVRANIYGQIRLPMKNTEFPGEDLKEALASLVFIELQDEFTIAHGKRTAYVASVSETEHYFILLTFRPVPAKKATSD